MSKRATGSSRIRLGNFVRTKVGANGNTKGEEKYIFM
jgi:hypothetical protein